MKKNSYIKTFKLLLPYLWPENRRDLKIRVSFAIVALVLAKKTNQSPIKLAELLKGIILQNLDDFSEISIAGPGFINFRFSTKMYQKIDKKLAKEK